MRFPHRDASAVGGRGCLRRSWLMLTAFLALISGCAVQRTLRVVEGQAALAPLDPGRVRSTFTPPDWGSRTGGAKPLSVPQPSSMASPESSGAAPPSTTVIPGRQVYPEPPAVASRRDRPDPAPDEQVKRVADEEMNAIVPSPPVIPPPSGEYPLDLATALRLADVANPTIGRARTVILDALAQQLTARTLLVPSLNGGGNYHGHNGALQRPTGKIELISEQSLYLGAGAGAVAVRHDLADPRW